MPASDEAALAAAAAGLEAVWRRANVTLGVVTLAAIADRVVHHTRERFKFLPSLAVGEAGIDLRPLRERIPFVAAGEVRAAAVFLVGEWVTILGHLTAEVLTPALVAALDASLPADRPTGADGRPEEQVRAER